MSPYFSVSHAKAKAVWGRKSRTVAGGALRRPRPFFSLSELRSDLDLWIREYNEQRPHQGRWCFGKTPMQTFLDAMPMTKEKMIAA
jgi:transposase InsO family protein